MTTTDVTGSAERRPGRFDDSRDGFALVATALAFMWIVEILDQLADLDLDRHGIVPRETSGLDGVLWAPFLHGGFGHLIGNTVPFLVLGAGIALSGAMRVVAVTAIVALVGGLGTWLVAPENTVHIGASGLVFGFAGFLVARGYYTRKLLHIAAAVAVVVVYGFTLLRGLVPEEGVSWQGHFFGAVGGVVAAWVLHVWRPTQDEQGSLPG